MDKDRKMIGKEPQPVWSELINGAYAKNGFTSRWIIGFWPGDWSVWVMMNINNGYNVKSSADR